jgi:hypothetical protein
MYENQSPGIWKYFVNKQCDFLLADQPGILREMVSNTRNIPSRTKGSHMSKEIKLIGEGKIKDYLISEVSPGTQKLNHIYSEPLLEELIAFTSTGNFDRVMAFMQVIIYREELYNIQVKQRKEEARSQQLFESPLFTKYYNDGYLNEINNEINKTTTIPNNVIYIGQN